MWDVGGILHRNVASLPMTRTLSAITIAVTLTLLASSAMTGAGPAGRPLLISVDDLPVAGGGLHTDPGER